MRWISLKVFFKIHVDWTLQPARTFLALPGLSGNFFAKPESFAIIYYKKTTLLVKSLNRLPVKEVSIINLFFSQICTQDYLCNPHCLVFNKLNTGTDFIVCR